MHGKYGKLPAQKLFGVGTLADYATGRLPAPPAQAHYGHLVKDFPMDGNDQYGDCTIAAVAHMLQAFNAEVRGTDTIPTERECVSTYLQLTGGQDSGLVEVDVLNHWKNQGFWGHKIAGYAPVPTNDLTQLHQAVAFYGGAYLGVQIPQSAETQFDDGLPWTVVPGSPIVGGHAIPIVGYDPNFVYVVTWGAIAAVTYPWLAHYLDEAFAIIAPEFVAAGRGPVLALAELEADLAQT